MKARQFESLLVTLSGLSAGELNQRTRPLWERNLIPYGPRGLGAPEIEPLHAALMILTMVSKRATDSGSVMARAMDLKAVERPGAEIMRGHALATLLASAMVKGSSLLQRLEVSVDGAMAWATCQIDARVVRVLFCEPDIAKFVKRYPNTYDAQGSSLCAHWLVIGPGFIDQAMIELSEAEDARASYAPEPNK